jgi:hypothetical protein
MGYRFDGRTNWTLVVHLVDNGKTAEVRPETPWPKGVKVGDRMYFHSPDGKVKVVFDDVKPSGKWPFAGGKTIEGARQGHEVKNACKFEVYCFIKPRRQARFLGWGKRNPRAGMTGSTGG